MIAIKNKKLAFLLIVVCALFGLLFAEVDNAKADMLCQFKERVDLWNTTLGGGVNVDPGWFTPTISGYHFACGEATIASTNPPRWTCSSYEGSHFMSTLAGYGAPIIPSQNDPQTGAIAGKCSELSEMKEKGCCVTYRDDRRDTPPGTPGEAKIEDCQENVSRIECQGTAFQYVSSTGKTTFYEDGVRDEYFVPTGKIAEGGYGDCKSIKASDDNRCPQYDEDYGYGRRDDATEPPPPTKADPCGDYLKAIGCVNAEGKFVESDNCKTGMFITNPQCGFCGDCGVCDFVNVFLNAARFGLGLLGVIALLMFIIGGVTWITSGGNQERVSKGRSILTGTVIGIIIVLLAWAVINMVVVQLTGSKTSQGVGKIFGREWNVCSME